MLSGIVMTRKFGSQNTMSTSDMSTTFREWQDVPQCKKEDFPIAFGTNRNKLQRRETSKVTIVPELFRSPEEKDLPTLKPNSPPTVCSAKQQHLRRDSNLVVDDTHKFPQYDLSEIHLGLILGKGRFAHVIEVKGFSIKSIQEAESNTSVNDDCDTDPSMSLERGAMVKMNGDNETARFALKRLHSTIRNDPHMLVQAIGDMATETRVLSNLTDHPHVIKLRGIARESDTTYRKDYFVILDRMYDTLDRRIRKWRMRDQELSGIQRLFRDMKQTKREQLWMDRLSFAYDLSSALAYLHSKHIIHRDLKPRNIGFDFQGKQFIIVLLL